MLCRGPFNFVRKSFVKSATKDGIVVFTVVLLIYAVALPIKTTLPLPVIQCQRLICIDNVCCPNDNGAACFYKDT